MRFWSSLCLMLALGAVPGSADLEVAKAERNLTKRSRLALENADKVLDAAREAYLQGDNDKLAASFEELEASVELAYQSLKDTGKKPRKAAKHYKRGEIGTRKLLRRLETFQADMSYLDREKIEEVIKTVQRVHDDFLLDVMGGR